MTFTFMQLLILFIIVYVCIYALIDRILKCVEHCATARAYSKFREAGIVTTMNAVRDGIEKAKEEKDDVAEGVN